VGQELAAAFELEAVLEMCSLVLAGPVFAGPAEKVCRLLAGGLCEQVVADADRQVAFLRHGLAAGVVIGERVPAPARIDRASHAEPVQLAVEVQR
jgi:hypothetical protein